MRKPSPLKPERRRSALWVTLAAALVYCIWLGVNWLPLGWSEHELSASASRVWDIKQELTQHHQLPWWTPYYMSGSSYGLNHSRGFYLVPWLLFSTFTGLQVAGKLTALCAIFASAVTMHLCARHFLRHEGAAVLAAVAYMLYPEQLTRAAMQEHITIGLFLPFVPLVWWRFARALQSGRFRDSFWCAAVMVLAMWTDNKQIVVQGVFLLGYLLYWLWRPEQRQRWQATLKTCGIIGLMSIGLGAALIVPGAIESKYVKLFFGDPLEAWQRTYSCKSLFALVDRDGVITRQAIAGVMAKVNAGGFRPTSQTEATQLQARIAHLVSLQMDSPEKYAGIVLLALVAGAALFNRRRVNRPLFWFWIAMLLLSVALAMGLSNVWSANLSTFGSLFGLEGVPSIGRAAALATLAVGVGVLTLFARRKLTSGRKWAVAGCAFGAFLFVPIFRILASAPYFHEIRAPGVFYSLPFAFFGSLLVGFFVTDVLEGSKWQRHMPKIIAIAAALMFVDYWPYQKPIRDNGVPAHTLRNLQATYGLLQQDKDWVKTYSVSGRYFHLLGPMWGGKPQVYEAFYNWMCPIGTGLLNQQAFSSWDNHRAFLNLLAARYIVFDKSDPNNAQQGLQQILDAYRQSFPVAAENEDFVVFRNDSARPYVCAYARACLFDGELRDSPRLALALDAHNWPLVHAPARPESAGKYESVYRDGSAPPPLRNGEMVPLADVQLVRENAQRIRIHLNAPRDCLAVVSESYYPFWRAEVDWTPVEVLRVSCGLMGLELPAGTHEIVLRYQPPGNYAAAAGLVC